LELLNRLQAASGGLVEAFEFMPDTYMRRLVEARPDVGEPFARRHAVTILVELGATAPHLADPGTDGAVPLVSLLEETLAGMMDAGLIADAEVAQTEAQRHRMWQRRELAAEITVARKPSIDTDIALPLDGMEAFFTRFAPRLAALDPGAETMAVAHLGDGNVHFTVFPTRADPTLHDAVISAVEDEVQALGGSFSAEHGVGLSKLASMARRKNPVALEVMRAVKAALDPAGLLNPGKVVPQAKRR
jgi:FAD/FMN-containing dehydrogenase